MDPMLKVERGRISHVVTHSGARYANMYKTPGNILWTVVLLLVNGYYKAEQPALLNIDLNHTIFHCCFVLMCMKRGY